MKGSKAALVVLAGLSGIASAMAGPVADGASEAENLQANGNVAAADAAMRKAYAALWRTGPLFLRRVELVDEPAAALGDIATRERNVYAPGEPIRLYVEPGGYGFAEVEGGYGISFRVDAEIIAENGTTIWGRRDLERFGGAGGTRNFGFFETLTFNLEGLPVGRYTIGTTLTDLSTGKSLRIDTPIVIE
jgi:hypothetical protein